MVYKYKDSSPLTLYCWLKCKYDCVFQRRFKNETVHIHIFLSVAFHPNGKYFTHRGRHN